MNNTMRLRRTYGKGRYSRRRRFGNRVFKRKIMGVMRKASEVKFAISGGNGGATILGAGSAGTPPYKDIVALLDITPTFPQGVDKYQRIGNSIQYKFLTLRLNLAVIQKAAASVFDPGYYVRVVLYQKRVLITNPWDVIWSGPAPTLSIYAIPESICYPVNNQNVRILNDELIPLSGYQANSTNPQITSGTPSSCSFTWRHKVNNHVNFVNSSNTQPTDPKDQYGLLIFVKGSGTTPNTDANNIGVNYSYCLKLSYTDS